MALRPLHPAVTESLGNGWDLVASEGGRSSKGLRTSVTLFNGTAQACRTLAVGDPAEQQTVATEFAGIVGLEASAVYRVVGWPASDDRIASANAGLRTGAELMAAGLRLDRDRHYAPSLGDFWARIFVLERVPTERS